MDDLDAVSASFFFLAGGDLERRQKTCIDELTQDFFCCVFVFEYGKQLVHVASGAGSLGGDQIAEDFPNDGDAIGADLLERCFGVLRQSAADTTDVLVRFPREQPLLSVAVVPESRCRKS